MSIVDISGRNVPDAGTLRRTDGAFLVCDLTDLQSLQHLEETWLPEYRQASGRENDERPVAVIGNKVDAKGLRKIGLGELGEAAERMGAPEPELTSARSDVNIEKEVRRWARRALAARGIHESEEGDDTFQIDETSPLIDGDGLKNTGETKRGCFSCCQ